MVVLVPPLPDSPNFGFLAHYDGALLTVAVRAEQYFATYPTTTLMKLRQFGEMFAQQLAARTGVFAGVDEPQASLLGRLQREGVLSALAPTDQVEQFSFVIPIYFSEELAAEGPSAVRKLPICPRLARELTDPAEGTYARGDRGQAAPG